MYGIFDTMRLHIVHVFATMKEHQVHLPSGEVWYSRYFDGASDTSIGEFNSW